MGTACGSILVALAWLYTITGAKPVLQPDISSCKPVTNPKKLSCCPPTAYNYVNFTLPPYPSNPRVRPAAHLASSAYVNKYIKALGLMRNLSSDNPWSFAQQANIHCAYCNNAYSQSGYNKVKFQAHGSWLFFPFHRAYLYFYERILGKLLNDPTFAIPFWNWDHPDGMVMPSMFTTSQTCALYDSLRDAKHQPPTMVNLNFNGDDSATYSNKTNLSLMYKQMYTNGPNALMFLGGTYYAGGKPNGTGSLEGTPHGNVHIWTGDRTQTYNEDMGTFYSAGRDPIFYSHHSNVDRMWEVWKTLGGNRANFNSSDWLESAFFFWDENKQLVRIRVRDVLDTTKLGYVYQNVSLPWKGCKSTKVFTKTPPPPSDNEAVTFPLKLKTGVSVMVNRPRVLRSRADKDAEEEALVVENIIVGSRDFVKFDVYINAAPDDPLITPEATQFAGSFVNVPMGDDDGDVDFGDVNDHGFDTARGTEVRTRILLGMTDTLEDLGLDDQERILVSLVPQYDWQKLSAPVRIGDLKIEYISNENN